MAVVYGMGKAGRRHERFPLQARAAGLNKGQGWPDLAQPGLPPFGGFRVEASFAAEPCCQTSLVNEAISIAYHNAVIVPDTSGPGLRLPLRGGTVRGQSGRPLPASYASTHQF